MLRYWQSESENLKWPTPSSLGSTAPSPFVSFQLLFKTPSTSLPRLTDPQTLQLISEGVVCAVAASGTRFFILSSSFSATDTVLVLPALVPSFIRAHKDRILVSLNTHIHYLVLHDFFDDDEKEELAEVINEHRWRDLLLIDALLRLATNDDDTVLRSVREKTFYCYHLYFFLALRDLQ